MDLCLGWLFQIGAIINMPNNLITHNKVDISPLVKELVEYVKDQKAVGDLEQLCSKIPMNNSPDWKLISGVLCNSIVEWASQNSSKGGKDLIQHLQSDLPEKEEQHSPPEHTVMSEGLQKSSYLEMSEPWPLP